MAAALFRYGSVFRVWGFADGAAKDQRDPSLVKASSKKHCNILKSAPNSSGMLDGAYQMTY